MVDTWPKAKGFESVRGQRILKRLRGVRCIICGKKIPLGSKGRKYCGSKECERKLWQSRDMKRRHGKS
jgi:hypothetical protein